MAAQAQDILSTVDLTGDQATANVGGEKVTAGTDAMTSNPNAIQQGVVPNLEDLLHHYRRMADHIDGLLLYAVENPITSDDKKFQPFQDFIPVIKLTRLFINKISRINNSGPCPLSRMSLDDLSVPIPSNEISLCTCRDRHLEHRI
ncbi:hypothetical protein Pst134EB_001326 [Puccinia striiformis f. sp. tritici]|nr:hypothetical protein Pst134EB_001326 [Puccinia striiformis f. sp. tritici]